jgi:ABC-type polysaccharide/polyol phosphate transport system ATPase subunit
VTSIAVEGAGVRFLFDRHRRVATPMMARLRRGVTASWGVRDVDLSIGAGEGVALLGASGSGKTTLLRLLARIYVPDEGGVAVDGRIASLLSIDAGLLPPLTGRENASLLMTLAGLRRRAAARRIDDVRTLARLEDSFERPVSSYSQGMRARLSLGVGETTNASVLLLDEVHEALDHAFRAILERRTQELRAGGGIVVAAGHDHTMLARLCDRAVWLDGGRVVLDGAFADVQEAYVASVS